MFAATGEIIERFQSAASPTAKTLTLTNTSGGNLSMKLSWKAAAPGMHTFVIIEVIQQLGEGGSGFGVKHSMWAICLHEQNQYVTSGDFNYSIGNASIANTLKFKCDTRTPTSAILRSEANWNYYGNKSKNHTFTVNIKQFPVHSSFDTIGLSEK
jgi:hypothetical protein